MNRERVGEEVRGKEMDGCPLTAPAKPAKDKELAYHTTTPIQNHKIVMEVYN
jgi:hypothetical protein